MEDDVRNDVDARLKVATSALKSTLASTRLISAARRLQRLRGKANFDPNQPRAPAGALDGGRWISVGNGRPTIVAGGFADDQLGLTVQEFVSTHCRASIYSVLPSEFLGMTIDEVMAIARSGDAAARRCLKLLGRERFRK